VSASEIFSAFVDTYERQARLYPALLAGVPIFAAAVGIYGVSVELKEASVGILASIGIVYLLSTISRELGKRLEGKLFAQWGGKPTTQLLRHKNTQIDPVTKARYHAFLANKLAIQFPSVASEATNPADADAIYESGARWLLECTRDRKRFPLLFKELVAYGFRRNSLGLKWIALGTALLCLVWAAAATGAVDLDGFHKQASRELSRFGMDSCLGIICK
jgi:hypothetical protein